MKTKLAFLLAFVFTAFLSLPTANAGPVGGAAYRVRFTAQSTVGTSVWVPVVTSTPKGIKGVQIFSSAGFPLEVGLAFATESAGAETSQLVIPTPLTAVGAPGAIYYPLAAGYGTRISIRSKGSVATEIINSGELDMSVLYN